VGLICKNIHHKKPLVIGVFRSGMGILSSKSFLQDQCKQAAIKPGLTEVKFQSLQFKINCNYTTNHKRL